MPALVRAPANARAFTDARGQAIVLEKPPRRIVSLVPSQTELLAYLGLAEETVGLTRFCVRPEGWKKQKTIVGGTKNVNLASVKALRPDLILANREENTRADVEALERLAPVYVTDVADVEGACAMIRAVGRLADRADRAERLVAEIESGFAALPAFEPIRTTYLIWRGPYMTVGGDTFIHDVMQRGGFVNLFADQTRYPEVTSADLAPADLILLPDEPFPFDEKYAEELRERLPERVPIRLVDGQPFCWYGPRLRHTPAYLQKLRAATKSART